MGGIPDITVGVVIDGRSWMFDDGVASLRSHSPVTAHTSLEIDSTRKTFTATLAPYAIVTGRMAPTDKGSIAAGTDFSAGPDLNHAPRR